jgi:hypothetical protein
MLDKSQAKRNSRNDGKKQETETITAHDRENIIVRTLKQKRRLFRELMLRENHEKSKNVQVSNEQCRALLTARTNLETASALEAIDHTIFDRKNPSDSGDQITGQDMAKNFFRCYTDERLGPTWKRVVEESVRFDMERKRTLNMGVN